MTEQSISLEDTLSIKQNNEALQGDLAKSQEQRKQLQIEIESVMKNHMEALELEYQARE